jgi:nucleoside-diphosphate-sugar epimerase
MTELLTGKYKTGAPELSFGFVDVRDVAKAHILGLETETKGRHILVERVAGILEMATVVKSIYGEKYKVPKSYIPRWILMLVGPFVGFSRKFIKNNVGHDLKLDNLKSKKELGLQYIPFEKTIEDMVEQMKLQGIVK